MLSLHSQWLEYSSQTGRKQNDELFELGSCSFTTILSTATVASWTSLIGSHTRGSLAPWSLCAQCHPASVIGHSSAWTSPTTWPVCPRSRPSSTREWIQRWVRTTFLSLPYTSGCVNVFQVISRLSEGSKCTQGSMKKCSLATKLTCFRQACLISLKPS